MSTRRRSSGMMYGIRLVDEEQCPTPTLTMWSSAPMPPTAWCLARLGGNLHLNVQSYAPFGGAQWSEID
jgi:hypothetical protein